MTSPDGWSGAHNPGWSDMGDMANQYGNAVGQVKETAMTGAAEAAAAAALSAANEEANIANSTAIAEANLAIGTKANIEDIPTDVPGFISLNPVDDAVFPSSEMVPLPTIVNRQTSNEAGDSYHSHSHNAAITWVEPIYTTAINRLDLGYINATRDRIYNTVGFTIAEQNQPTKATVRIGIYKMGKTAAGFPDGNLTLIWISPSGANIQGQFGLAAQDIKVDLGVDILATKGDWFAVCVVQTGSANTQRHLLGKQTARKNALSGVFPTRLAMTRAGETAPPMTLTPAQLDNSSTWVPWMFMGQSLGLIKISLVDLFDRANSGALGPNWATYGAGMDIVNGVAQCKRINRGNLTARVEDRSQGVYVSQLATDTMAASGKIDAFDRSQADLEDNPRAQITVRSNADMTRGVTAGIRWGLIEIRVYSNANPAGITRNSTLVTQPWANGDVVELRATDDVTTGKTDFTVYINGSPVLTWPDLQNEASKGPAFRRAAFETASTHRGAIFGYRSIPSVGVNEWKARDL
ncbi:minor tail protein [Rhodococcus phage Whack]|uniref:Minor tail protein n=1 Tax=Rhodococcus phage Whack TaxID=2591132 RepID=A0A515MKC9_9CAUD|nr:minor tail protein [Rhodococcus phage Whack]QDM57089.1 minor tail protein [Rhodococcus phage Whack]